MYSNYHIDLQSLFKNATIALLPPHPPAINFTTLQQPSLHPTRTPPLLILHSINIHTPKSTNASLKLPSFDFLPDHQNVLRAERDAIGNAPEESEGDFSRSTWHGLGAAGGGEDGVGYEERLCCSPVQEEGAGKVPAGQDGCYAWDGIWEDGCVEFCEDAEIGAGYVSSLEPFLVGVTDEDWAVEGT